MYAPSVALTSTNLIGGHSQLSCFSFRERFDDAVDRILAIDAKHLTRPPRQSI